MGEREQVRYMKCKCTAKAHHCHICEKPTDVACSDCAINLNATVYVCVSSTCRQTHEYSYCSGPNRQISNEFTVARLGMPAAVVVKTRKCCACGKEVQPKDWLERGVPFSALETTKPEEFHGKCPDCDYLEFKGTYGGM